MLHDPYGCAAFLGGFAPTADIKRYCTCKRPGATLLSVVHALVAQPPVVGDGSAQALRVVHERDRSASIRVEALR